MLSFNSVMFRGLICLLVAVINYVSSAEAAATTVTTVPGQSALLTCIDAPNEPSQITWKLPNGQQVPEDKEGGKYARVNNTLKVTVIADKDDLGTYTCTAANKTKDITVESSPYVTRMPKSFNHVLGETATVECTAWGYPEPTITWFRKKDESSEESEQLINGGKFAMLMLNSSTKFETHDKLTVGNLSYEDYGIYICNATNRHGAKDYSTKIRVKNNLAPLWPFLGILLEILILVVIIVIYEKRKAKQTQEEEIREKADNQTTNANDHKDEENVRFRNK